MSQHLSITKKILARASGRETVEPEEFVEAKVDAVMVHDLTAPLALKSWQKLKEKRVWDRSRVIVVFDHQVPADTVRSAELQRMVRKFVAEYGIQHFYDIGRAGIAHQFMVERALVKPGDLLVGADSHTCTCGAVGAFSTGVGSTDVAAVFATGLLWFKVPEVIRITITGTLKNHLSPKDLILHIIGTIGSDGANYKGLEFTGQTVREMSIDGRMTLCNMVVEVGAKSGIVEPDDKTLQYVRTRSSTPFTPVLSDPDARYEGQINVEADGLEPQVACPHEVDNVKPAAEVGEVEIDQAFIGSCTNGRLEDLRVAARILKGRKIKDGVRMVIIPASQEIYKAALEEELVKIFVEAGAFFGPPTCGPCLGGHFGLLADDETCVSSSNRNFMGRMGSPKAKIYLASPATVAASAVAGKLVNPRDVMEDDYRG